MQVSTRPDPGPWLLVAYTALATLWFVSPWFPGDWLARATASAGGWIGVTLVASALIGLGQLAIVTGPGRASLASLGWQPRALPPALLVGALLWAAMQVGTMVAAAAGDTPVETATAWQRGAGHALGPLLAQLLGTALFEETVFRGYLWPALSRRFAGLRWPRLAGALASQALFALLHVPMLLARGLDASAIAGTVLVLLVTGLVFVAVYASTRNLFVAVGIHALGNAPTMLFEPQGQAPTMLLLAGTLLLCVCTVGIRHIRTTMVNGTHRLRGVHT